MAFYKKYLIITRIFLAGIFISVHLMAINPPNSGNFPEGFWEEMYDDDIGMKYGDPGWIKRINNWKNNSNRNTQLTFNIPVLLGNMLMLLVPFFQQLISKIYFLTIIPPVR